MKFKGIKKISFLINLIYFFNGILTTIPSILFGIILDHSLEKITINEFLKYSIYLFIIVIFSLLSGLAANNLKSKMMMQARMEMESRVFNKVISGYGSIDKAINLFDTEINLVIENQIVHIGDYVRIFTPLVVALSYSFAISPKTMAMIAAGFVLVMIVNEILLRPVSQKMNLLSKRNEEVNYKVRSFVKPIVSIKVYEGIELAQNALRNVLRERNDVEKEKRNYLLIVEGINCLFTTLIQLLPLGILVYMLVESRLTLGEALSIMLLLEKIVSPVDQVVGLKEDMACAKDANEHIDEITRQDMNQDEKRDLQSKEEIFLTLKNVCAKYGDKTILENVSIHFEFGKKYLILGENGSGKSTLFKLITGQMDRFEGEISLNDKNIREMNQNEIFQYIGYLPQQPELIEDDLETNISLEDGFNNAMLNQCIEKVQLSHLKNMQETVNTIASGGEKQRIAIARMLYHPKPIYLLDEVTCGLDSQHAEKIERILLNLESTVIHISHRTSSELMQEYDKVIRFSEINKAYHGG